MTALPSCVCVFSWLLRSARLRCGPLLLPPSAALRCFRSCCGGFRVMAAYWVVGMCLLRIRRLFLSVCSGGGCRYVCRCLCCSISYISIFPWCSRPVYAIRGGVVVLIFCLVFLLGAGACSSCCFDCHSIVVWMILLFLILLFFSCCFPLQYEHLIMIESGLLLSLLDVGKLCR